MSVLLIAVVFVLLAGAGLGAIAFMAASQPAIPMDQSAGPKALPNSGVDVLNAKITDVRRGGLVEAKSYGDEFEDVNLSFDAYNRFSFNSENWHELVSQYKGRTAGVEWQDKASGKEYFAMRYLRCKTPSDVGIDDVDSLEEGATASFEGRDFTLKRKGDGEYHRGGDGFGKAMQFWEFRAEDDAILRVERLKNSEATLSMGHKLSEGDFDIMRVQG